MRKHDSIPDRFPATVSALLLPLVLAAALSGAAAAYAGGQTAAPGRAAFPLSAGTSWIYQAVVRWGSDGSSATQEKLIAWKMQVERVIPRGKLVAAVIKGFPRDLDRSHGDTAPAESIIVVSGGAKFYWIPPAATTKALERLENSADQLSNLTSADEIFLELPLAQGNKFCDMTGMIRTDGFYCWIAEEPQVADLAGVKGVPSGSYTSFPVRFLTTSNATSYDFVPGIGITRYRFQVHGSQTDTELRLEEFHRGTH